jgi:hypothetical protein
MIVLIVTLAGCNEIKDTTQFHIYKNNNNNELGLLLSLTTDSWDNLYAIGGEGNKIFKFDNYGNNEVIFTLSNLKRNMCDFVIDEKGIIYVIESTGTVIIVGTDGLVLKQWIVKSKEMNLFGIDIDSKHNIYITNQKDKSILVYSQDGILINEYRNKNNINNPIGIYVDIDDSVYYGDVVDLGIIFRLENDVFTPYGSVPIPYIIDKYKNQFFISDTYIIKVYSWDFSQQIETWDAKDLSVFPKSENNQRIIDLAINSKGIIYVIRDNMILIRDNNK